MIFSEKQEFLSVRQSSFPDFPKKSGKTPFSLDAHSKSNTGAAAGIP